ncbi:hypothetical protein JCM10908_006056 [Rhodotorula pacifica]|uniref:cell proliferation protein CDC123 n=1 Tax=Rhodotorula pacifica TaxID=1495444 RepID=UPI003173121D
MAIPLPSQAATAASEATDHDRELFPPLYTSDVLACQFSTWYPRFKRMAPKATIIRPLPEDEHLIDFLEADGLFLPEGSGPMGISELSDSDSGEEEEEAGDEEAPPVFSFPRLDAEIRSALEKYDGAVFPKLNWSSPQDAAWMLPGQNMKCQTPADVYLLLKSSDFISHDLDHAFEDCVDWPAPSSASIPAQVSDPGVAQAADDLARVDLSAPDCSATAATDTDLQLSRSLPTARARPYEFELVLKKWFDMPKSQEWRCFVRQDRLLGISQRDTTLYDFLQPEQAQQEICSLITKFWETSIRDDAPLSDYILDVYITRDRSRVFVIDFNPFAARTDPLLFSYPELHDLFLSSLPAPTSASSTATEPHRPELRVVTPSSNPASQSAVPRYAHNRYPKDVVDMSEGQSIAEFAKEWMSKVGEAAGFGEGGLAADGQSEDTEAGEKERVGR